MRVIRAYQGSDKNITISHDFAEMESATEIKVYLTLRNRNSVVNQIIKSMSDGVSAISSTDFLLTVSAEDTNSAPSGEYRLEAQITASDGSLLHGHIQPDRFKLQNTDYTTTD